MKKILVLQQLEYDLTVTLTPHKSTDRLTFVYGQKMYPTLSDNKMLVKSSDDYVIKIEDVDVNFLNSDSLFFGIYAGTDASASEIEYTIAAVVTEHKSS